MGLIEEHENTIIPICIFVSVGIIIYCCFFTFFDYRWSKRLHDLEQFFRSMDRPIEISSRIPFS